MTRRKWRLKSTTSPGPSVSPASPVPPLAAWIGIAFSAA